jgi:hypothetical protein
MARDYNNDLTRTIKRKFAHLSNEQLVQRINQAEDFGWDDEGYELERRIEQSGGTFDAAMQGSKLIILRDGGPYRYAFRVRYDENGRDRYWYCKDRAEANGIAEWKRGAVEQVSEDGATYGAPRPLKGIYTLMDEDGAIPEATYQLIHDNLINDLARQHLPACLQETRTCLEKAHAHVMSYGGLDIWAVRKWDPSARLSTFKELFLNEDVHRMDGWNKLRYCDGQPMVKSL